MSKKTLGRWFVVVVVLVVVVETETSEVLRAVTAVVTDTEAFGNV